MVPPTHPYAQIRMEDPRYAVAAYFFVFDALEFAHHTLGMGSSDEAADEEERHVTGQELCEAIRRYALDQFGFMAKCVLNSWGIHATSDFGEIVYNLIRHGRMRKTPYDRREHFDNVYDFQEAFVDRFRIENVGKPA